jgi:hypothetical protein
MRESVSIYEPVRYMILLITATQIETRKNVCALSFFSDDGRVLYSIRVSKYEI